MPLAAAWACSRRRPAQVGGITAGTAPAEVHRFVPDERL
jgi:hypothetical protein